jgi:thiol-disulfide isomerase/thioredoxin
MVLPESELLVVCLCAEWCVVCREYRSRFEQVQGRFAGVRFRWIDIEDESDLVDPVEVDDFPTLLIVRGDAPVFFGTVRPQPDALERLVRDRLAGTEAATPIRPEVLALARRLRAV